jgi:hypothetical protein
MTAAAPGPRAGVAAPAVAVLAEAREAGFRLWVERGYLRCVPSSPPELRERLRHHKPALVEMLRGDRCRACGQRMAWPGPAGIVHVDGTAQHHRCRVWPDAKPRPGPRRTANCASCRRVAALDATGSCSSCAAEPLPASRAFPEARREEGNRRRCRATPPLAATVPGPAEISPLGGSAP